MARRTTRAIIGIALAVTTGLVMSPAQSAASSPDRVAALAQTLGDDRSAGTHYDATGALIVNVTDVAAANAVTAAGGTARLVGRSARELNAIVALDPHVAGTAWSVDTATNQVVVDVAADLSGAALGQVQAAVARANGGARIEKLNGTLQSFISGGDAIYGGSSRCSLGFNVRSGTTYYFLTAGHCTNIATTWYANSSHTTTLGTRHGTSFPGNDYGIVRYTNTTITKSGAVGSQDITSARNAVVGESVRRRGSTTGTRSGSVTGLNATVNYSQGTVYGMIRTNVCAEPGDSGGPLYNGTAALGLTSGGSGNCTTGGTTFFQPVVEALNRYGVSVY